MRKTKRFLLSALSVMILAMIVSTVPVNAAHERATYYRGSVLMWTRDNVDFYYDGNKVISSSGYQQAGYIFPSIARNISIKKYHTTPYSHSYRAENEIGGGVLTPWGGIKVFSATFVHRIYVRYNGDWYGYADD